MKDNVTKLHEYSLEILRSVGIELQDKEILNFLKGRGVKVENNRAYFTESEIMDNIKHAPSEFTLYAKNEKYNMNIDCESSYYTAGYGCAKIREYNGELRNATLDDYLKFVEMTHASDDFLINGGIVVQPNDIDARLSHLIMMYATMSKSDKCVLAIPGSKKVFEEVMDLVSIYIGSKEKLKEKPYMVTLISTLSPLKIDKNAIDCIKLCAEYKQPMVLTPGPMAGATGPITLAGNVAMGNAEVIAAIAISQMLNPGTPVIYGLACTTTEMKTAGVSIGSPGFALQASYGSNLAKFYNLPNRTSGGQCDANGVTSQSGYEAMMNLFMAHQEKANFIMHATGILDSYTSMSFEKFMQDLEIISMLKYYFNDINVDEKSVPIDVIREIATENKTFLVHKHTIKNCRKAPWTPSISIRGELRLKDTPDGLMKKSIDKRMKILLDSYSKPQLNETTINSMKDYLKSHGVDEYTIEAIDNYQCSLLGAL